MKRIMAAVVAIGILAGCSSSEPAAFSTEAQTTKAEAAGATEAVDSEAPSTDAPTTTTSAAKKAELVIESGFHASTDSIGTKYVSAGAVVTNPNSVDACNVQVIFTLVDAADQSIDTDSTTLPIVPAGGKAVAAPLQIGFEKPTPANMKVAWIVDSYGSCSSFTYRGIRLELSNVVCEEVGLRRDPGNGPGKEPFEGGR